MVSTFGKIERELFGNRRRMNDFLYDGGINTVQGENLMDSWTVPNRKWENINTSNYCHCYRGGCFIFTVYPGLLYFPEKKSKEVRFHRAGNSGYMAPEYVMHGEFSVKSDVFSFGVLILEIVTGKKSNSFYQSGGSENLLSHAWKHWQDGTPLDLVDPTLGDSVIGNEVIRCIHIGLLCVQEVPDERPTMTSVALMLNSYSVPLSLPHQPAFFLRSRRDAMLQQLELDSKSTWSVNEVSISELLPR